MQFATPPSSPRGPVSCPWAPKMTPVDEFRYRIAASAKATNFIINEEEVLDFIKNTFDLSKKSNTYYILSDERLQEIVNLPVFRIAETHRCSKCRCDMGINLKHLTFCGKVCQYGGVWV